MVFKTAYKNYRHPCSVPIFKCLCVCVFVVKVNSTLMGLDLLAPMR